MIDGGEVETVRDTHFARLGVDEFEAYILMSVLHFGHRRVRGTVGIDDAVTEKIAVARSIDAVIASVSPVCASVFIGLPNALIDPVPDESALQVRIPVNCLPLPPKIPVRISHGMPVGARILRHIHVRVPFPQSTLVVHGAVCSVLLLILDVQICLVKVVSVAGLVAERPERDARKILVAFVHVDGSIRMREKPFGVIAERTSFAQVVIHSVRFDVGLVVHVKSVFVT